MANITPEQQERFNNIIERIHTKLDPSQRDNIDTDLKELWEEKIKGVRQERKF